MMYSQETLNDLKATRDHLVDLERIPYYLGEAHPVLITKLDTMIAHLEEVFSGQEIVPEPRATVKVDWTAWHKEAEFVVPHLNRFDFDNGEPCYLQSKEFGGMIIDQGDPQVTCFVPYRFVEYVLGEDLYDLH